VTKVVEFSAWFSEYLVAYLEEIRLIAQNMPETTSDIAELMDRAQRGDREAVLGFYRALLDLTVFIPIQQVTTPDGGEDLKTNPTKTGERYYVSELDGKYIVPIFSRKDSISVWAEQDVPSVEKEFKTLLWSLREDVWLHLNPGQDVGKEISPWELERLKSGPDAIEEILSELPIAASDEVEVESRSSLFPELKKRITTVLEVYPQIDEAFLILVKSTSQTNESLLLGLKQHELTEAQIKSIDQEVSSFAHYQSEGPQIASVVADLAVASSPATALVVDAKPFYIAQKPYPGQKSLFSTFTSFFRRFGSKSKV